MADLPDLASFFSRAWDIYRRRWRVLLVIQAAGLGAIIATAVAATMLMTQVVPLAGGRARILYALLVFFGSSLAVLLTGFALWTQTALLFAVADPESCPGVEDCFQQSWAKLPGLLWVLLSLAAAGAGGFFLGVVPGLLVFWWGCLAPFIFLREGAGGFDALLRSRHYMRGRAWAVLLRLAALGAAAGLPGLVPVAGAAVQAAAMPLPLIGAAVLLDELRRGAAAYAEPRWGKPLLILCVAGLAVPVWLAPSVWAWASAHVLRLICTAGAR